MKTLVGSRYSQPLRSLLAIFNRGVASKISVKEALSIEVPKKNVTLLGWVDSARKQKNLTFVHVSDGSCIPSLQLVAPSDHPLSSSVNVGCSVLARGSIIESTHPAQRVEMVVEDIEIMGECNPEDYPFKAKTNHSLEYIRQFPHLRSRRTSFSSLLRIRHTAMMAIHEFFQSKGFVSVHTPILTSSDCEGAGNMFEVKPKKSFEAVKANACRTTSPESVDDEFFNCRAYLTVSGQLHAEAVASGMSSVYTFGPTFRAESSDTRRHLSEFYMVEAETVTLGECSEQRLDCLVELIEQLYKSTLQSVMERNSEEVEYFHDNIALPGTKTAVMESLKQPFKRLTYTEAIDILTGAKENFIFKPQWGCDLKSEHEQYLLAHYGKLPLFVTNYPAQIKPFYARADDSGSNDNHITAAALDLLVPVVGEVVGGTVREERFEVLKQKLERQGILENYQWYLDLRRFGSVPHGGFGLGFERLLQALLGVENIRDVTPFPRCAGSCEM